MQVKSSFSADSHVIRYRSEIDGLRAIAVLSVILFHLRKSALPGGYLGVDMFFVLSGYLITAIIWRESIKGRFSIVRFYDRRIRRIMPALLLLLAATTAISSLLLLPSDLIGYGRSLLATLIFAANVYFWRDTDYFSPAAEQKPLLHIWSLGVEEQFYILFPLILLLLARYWPHRAIHTLAALAAASLAVNMLALFIGGDVPAFFLLPTRAWELGAGSVLALLPAGANPRAAAAGPLAAAGMLLIVVAMLHPIDSAWFLPAALPAVCGTALLVLVGRDETSLVNRMLRLRPLVFVGLISYSLYLWHWPIIVFSQYYLVRPLTPVESAAAFALMLACAACSWGFVERRFRSNAMAMRRVHVAACLGVATLGGAAAVLLWSHGLPGRLSGEAAALNQAVGTNYRCSISDYLPFGGSRACVMNLPTRNPTDAQVILLGNSHAQMYAPVWSAILSELGQTGLLVPANGCLPTVQANISSQCLNTAVLNLAAILKLTRAHTVIIGLTWEHDGELTNADGRPVSNAGDRMLISALDDLLDRLRRAGKSVVLIGPIAEPGWDVASVLSRELAFKHVVNRPLFQPTADFLRRFAPVMRHFEARADIQFARPDQVQCPAERCYYVLDKHSLFSDGNHLAAAELPRFRAAFSAALAAAQARPAGGGGDTDL